jgi:transcriptional regulator with XRE-family HTH domain
MNESFGGRLRYERERRQIALRSIAESTKIGVALLEGLEGGDVSRWPSGIYRKSFVRAYAQAIGVDPEPVVREFIELYPDPQEDVPPVTEAPPGQMAAASKVLASARLAATARAVATLRAMAAAGAVNAARALTAAKAATTARAMSATKAVTPARAVTTSKPLTPARPVLLTVNLAGTTFTKGRFLADIRKRWAAAACDAAISCGIALCAFTVVGHFWSPLGISMLCYYGGGIVLLGNTPGVCLFAPESADRTSPNKA